MSCFSGLLFSRSNGKLQNTQNEKQKKTKRHEQKRCSSTPASSPCASAHELDDTVPTRGVDKKLEGGKNENLIDGKYKKTVYVKTWSGKTISATISLQNTVENMKEQIEEKTPNPKRSALGELRKSPDGQEKD